MKAKIKDVKGTTVISYRRKCKNNSDGTGLSHYITTTNAKKQQKRIK